MYLVLLLELHDRREVAKGAFHTVQTLDNDQNLLPWAVGLGLTLTDHLTKQVFQVVHVVVLEHANVGTTETDTSTNGSMVQLIRDNQTTLGDQSGDDSRVGRETHRAEESRLHAHETRNKRLGLDVQVEGTNFTTGTAR